MDYGVHAAAIG